MKRQPHLGYTWLGPGNMGLQRHREVEVSVRTEGQHIPLLLDFMQWEKGKLHKLFHAVV